MNKAKANKDTKLSVDTSIPEKVESDPNSEDSPKKLLSSSRGQKASKRRSDRRNHSKDRNLSS
jgi:hypothetical protein